MFPAGFGFSETQQHKICLKIWKKQKPKIQKGSGDIIQYIIGNRDTMWDIATTATTSHLIMGYSY